MAKSEKIKEVKSLVLKKVSLSNEEELDVEKNTKEFLVSLKKKIKEKGLNADIFLGGSAAKKTMINKKEYDIDIFLRFDKKYSDEDLNKAVEKLKDLGDGQIVKGSRNYLRFKEGNKAFEVIPITKIKNPGEARNVTDLSVFHVAYVENCAKKNKKIANEIKLAKAFVHASDCYGAESYVNGFSGYSLELLICHYKSLEKFLKAVVESKDKIILDPGKLYKSRKEVLENLNESKLGSAMILVDPTYKERNALAALSQETFEKFKKYCSKFLKNHNVSYFEKKEFDEDKLIERAKKKRLVLAKFVAKTNKQEGDIAGTKLLKFFRYLERQIGKYFDVDCKEFNYGGSKYANFYFILKSKDKLVYVGPEIKLEKAVIGFKQKHKNTYIKNKRIYAEEKLNMNLDKFLKKFQHDDNKVMVDMGIVSIDLA